MMLINYHSILPDGWHYRCAEYRIPNKSELPNPQAVVDAMLAYRLENNLPVGNPEADLEEYVCSQFPAWCRRSFGVSSPMPNVPGKRNVDLVLLWANSLYTQIGRLSLVPQREAEERAHICAKCPVQMEWARDCPPCVTSAQRLLSILRQGRDTEAGQQEACKGCAAHGWDNRTAVHLDRQHLPPQANPNAPEACWMRK